MTDIDYTPEIVSGELEPYQSPQPPANLFGTDDPVEVVVKATAVADALKDVIQRKNLFVVIQGKQHIVVDGWQLVGAMLGVTAVCTHTEAVEGGFKATVEARTVDGRVIGAADALCTKHEKRGPWKNADDYARLSMAQTRATSKALKGPLGFVISLAGYQTTPAEEMTFAVPDTPQDLSVPTGQTYPAPVSTFPASDAQVKLIKSLVTKHHVTPDELHTMLKVIGQDIEIVAGWTGKLTGGREGSASELISWLKDRPVPAVDNPTDVPVDDEGFVHPPVDADEAFA